MNDLLELCGYSTGNCMRVAIALEEASLPFAARHVDLRAAAHHQPEIRSLNPAGKVPVLVDRRSDEPIVITQSNAIMLHIAECVPGRLSPVAHPGAERARFLERILYFVTNVIAPSFAGFQARLLGQSVASDAFTRIAVAQLEASDRFLRDGEFMAGDQFSLVDIAAVTIASALERPFGWATLPALRAWYDRIIDRPSVVRGISTFG